MSATKHTAATRLHVLFLSPSFHGSEQPGPTRALELCDELVRSDHRVTLLTASSDQSSREGFEIINTGDRLQTPFGYPASSRALRSYTLQILWRIWRVADVDVVLVADTSRAILPLAMLFCAVRGVPLLVDAISGLPKDLPAPALWQRALTAINRNIYLHAVHYARRIFIQNANLKRALVESGIAEKSIVEMSAGSNVQLLRPSATTTSDAEEKGAAGSLGPVIVYAGRLNSDSELRSIVDIAAATQPILPGTTFMIYGDGPGRKQLEEYARKSGVFGKCVRILDPVPRSKLHLALAPATAVIARNQSDADWAPSGHVLDALAAERPVIFLGNNPHRELIVGRSAGLALPAKDTQIAARELSDFLNDADGLRRAREQAAALAAGRLNSDRVAADIRTSIESAANEAPREAVARQRTLKAKRGLDIIISLSALVVLSPVLVGLALAIQFKMGAPVIFSQRRPGLKGKIFKLYKFRTMTNEVNAAGASLPDSDRLTPFGQFMRRTSLDELPELLNVLMGDMSLVGPRPLLPEYLPHYSTEQKRRHDVLPGLTGWTQISGRNALTWEEKFILDVWYVDNLSLLLDLKILLKTIWVAIRGEGVNAPGYSTMPRFDEIMARREGAEDE